MHVGVGYSDNPDSTAAGLQAVKNALDNAQRKDPCDVVLLFCTARHNQKDLRAAVASAAGEAALIYGGGAVGIITNETFGYAGDQVGVACLWMDGEKLDAVIDGGLLQSEEETGVRMGQKLAQRGTTPTSPVMLFYDAVDRTGGGVRLLMATWLLAGLEKGLGFLPPLTGAGMQGDHICSPTHQYIGAEMGDHQAMALAFPEDIRIDSTIMHGCRPASGYFTVTKSEGPVILEINNTPAITFIDNLLDSSITPEEYPFFLLFGINHGERWGEYDENNYASRLCLGIDKERGGIVMFEPDMVPGTEFQLMVRSMEFDYMKPKIETLFDNLGNREPLFAMYIDCAGRCAGYGGIDLEDAVVVQQVVNNRVPLLGLYTGVEIAPIGGRPRGLDWTGVFCLFSKSKNGASGQKQQAAPTWETRQNQSAAQGKEGSMDAVLRLCEQNAAKVLSLDTQSIAIRHELEQKRRGFKLLAELSVSLRRAASYESVFVPVAQRINAALNMQKTAVLVPGEDGQFTPLVLQGYSVQEKTTLAGKRIAVPAEMLDPEQAVLVTGADSEERLAALREALMLPYFISSPVILQNEVAAILITGRMVEQTPFLSRLGHNDIETVQAISALLASVIVHQRLEAAEERAHIMVDSMPLCCAFWDEKGNPIDCNDETLRLFGLKDKNEFYQKFHTLVPETQPDGRLSVDAGTEYILGAFASGNARFEWVYTSTTGELLPTEVTLLRVPRGEDYNLVGYIRDLREQKAAIEEISRARDLAEQNVRAKNEFLASVSHEVRTPLNAITAMARTVQKTNTDEAAKPLIDQGVRSARLLSSAIDSILDFTRMEAGQVALEAKEFSVRDTVNGITGMLAEEAAEKGLALRAEVEPDVPETVIGDATRLEQTIFNLVANAVKFTEKGEVVIHARKTKAKQGKVSLVFDVRDTGIGISAEQQERLFEPLGASDTSYSRKYGGLGMGLAVSRSLAALMEGDISVESIPGEGSTFSLTVVLGLPQTANKPAEQPAASLEELAGMRVLLAEDNPINQMIVEELLAAAGITVVTAGTGLEALKALENDEFDLVLMDIQMPEMDGLTATAQIRQNPRYNDMPILAMTANSAEEHKQESLKSGMNDHLTKPIDVDEVYAALKRWGKRKAK